MKKLSLLLAAFVMLLAPISQAQNNCGSLIVDKAGVISNPQMVANAARTLVNQGADVHVVTIDSLAKYGANLEAAETFIESKCPSWTTNGVRKANLFVVMVAPNDRAKNIFLGSYYAGSFDIPSTYSSASNSYFKAHQFDAGLAAVLNATSNRAIAFRAQRFAQQQQQARTAPVYTTPRTTYTPTTTYPTTTTTPDSGGHTFLIVIGILIFIAVVIAIIVFATNSSSSTTTYVSNDTGYSGSTGVRPVATTRRYAAAAPTQTTVIHEHYDNSGNNLVTGMLIGEALSRPSYQPPVVVTPGYVSPSPVYTDPTPIPDPTPVVDSPDSTWEEPTTQSAPVADTQDTGWNNDPTPSYEPDPTPSYDPPSSDFGSSGGDTGF